MKAKKAKNERPSVLDVVALLTDRPAHQLARGQVGTVVEQLDDKTLLVEFSDDQGRAYAIAPCLRADLLVLHYVPEAA
jgi:predicted transcriptional regulator